MSSVAIVKDRNDPKESIKVGMDLIGGFGSLMSPVLIKPNICTSKDGTGHSVSDVKVTEAIIELLLEEKPDLTIKIVETDSMNKFADDTFKIFGYQNLVDRMTDSGKDVLTVNLTHSETMPIDYDGIYYNNPELPEEIVEPHYYISQAIAKTHYLTFLTGAVKNQFGLVQEKGKASLHSNITGIIVDLTRIVKPKLCITDARVGVEGWNGPVTHKLDSFVIGHQPVSVDATVTRMMGFDPSRIEHLREATKYGLGTLDPEVLGESLDSFEIQFSPPSK